MPVQTSMTEASSAAVRVMLSQSGSSSERRAESFSSSALMPASSSYFLCIAFSSPSGVS